MNLLAPVIAFAIAYWFLDGLFAWIVVIAFVIWLASKVGEA